MRIENNFVWHALRTYANDQAKQKDESNSSVEKTGDSADISAEAKLLQKAMGSNNKNAEFNTAKVEKVKAQIANGTYSVDSEELAKAILNRSLTGE